MASKSNTVGKDNSGVPARSFATEALARTISSGRAPDEILHSLPGWEALIPEDRGLSHLLLLGTLRRLGQIDRWLARLMERPLPPAASKAGDILRIGLFQLGWMGTPAHAAVDVSVSLTRCMRLEGFSGLVNAVLRRAAREGLPEEITRQPALNLPDWLRESWSCAYGSETVNAVCRAQAETPPIDIQVKEDPQGWADRLAGKLLPGGVIRISSQPVSALPGYAEGAWWVQDAAATLPARLLGEVKGRTIVDLCAAPGGKTAQLAAAGAKVIAVDRSETRLARLRENLARLKLDAHIHCADATQWKPAVPIHGVLLDAPCSATGTLRRHPEIALTRTPEDVGRLAALQARLLQHVMSWLPPGIPLVYATCSLQPEEGEERMAALLKECPEAYLQPIMPSECVVPEAVLESGCARTLPHYGKDTGGMDGFFMARLIKN